MTWFWAVMVKLAKIRFGGGGSMLPWIRKITVALFSTRGRVD